MKRTALRRRPHRDPVTPTVRIVVLERDEGCVAVRYGESPANCRGRLTLDHVKDELAVGQTIVKRPRDKRDQRAPSDPAHLVTLCEWHHLAGWATAHRTELRGYLAQRYPYAWDAWLRRHVRVWPPDPLDPVGLGTHDDGQLRARGGPEGL